MDESSFCWFEPELRRIEAMIVAEERLKPGDLSEGMLRDAVACARRFGLPLFEYRCLASLADMLGPGNLDFELESRV